MHELSDGQWQWTDGMLYPVLHRLEAQGFVIARWLESDSGRKRKYYSIRPAGKKILAEHQHQWLMVQRTLAGLWGAPDV